jgi:hypothetical protein
MTNPIGCGTANLSVNVPLDEKLALGKLAFTCGQSQGELVRQLTLRGLEAELKECEDKIYREIGFVSRDGEIALMKRTEALRQTVQSIRQTRKMYYGAMLLAVFVALIVLSESQDMRRARRNRAEEEVEEVSEA